VSRAARILRLIVCTATLAWWAAPPALAQGLGSGPSWNELTPAQRTALAPLQQEWAGIDGSRRAKWLEIAARFPTLPAAEQARVQGRMAEWTRLTPAERGRARANFQEAKQVPAQERQARWEAYQALPPDQREALGTADRRGHAGRSSLAAGAGDGKRNIVGDSSLTAPPPKSVAPTVVQAGPGATTTLVTRQGLPPTHQQPGLPKVAAPQGFVDRDTLLPKRGAQGAATRNEAASPATPAPRARP
jgi:Protein of unknown function (DUF3106)